MIKRKPVGAGSSGARGDGGAGPAAQLSSRLDVVRELARIANEFELEEIEFEPDGRIRISRRAQLPVPALGPVPGASAAPALAVVPAPPAPPTAASAAPDALFVTSPFVGTFYRSPSPEAPVFIDVGQEVRKGQVVCIIEAMKLMNEIESEVDGKVSDVLVKNGEHVEYGQPLFRIAKP
jgi:acetyl-CoA carboxylase biotin carboxyl carrier protein